MSANNRAVCWGPLRPAILACVAIAVCSAPARAQVGSLRVQTRAGTQIGTAFPVSRDGYLATSFRLMQRATDATFVLPNNTSHPLAGWVAASQAHDVVIVALRNSVPLRIPSLTPVFTLKPGEVLGPTPGPLSQPLMQQLAVLMPGAVPRNRPAVAATPGGESHFEFYAPQLRCLLSGTELMAGWTSAQPFEVGHGPDTRWIALDISFESSYAGAPLWDNAGQSVHGMITGPSGEDGRLRLGVQIQHVIDLIPNDRPRLRPLSSLARYEDPPASAGQAPGDGTLAERSLPLADRFTAHAARLVELEQGIATLQQTSGKHKANANAARAKIDLIDDTVRNMRPEQPFQETFFVQVPGDKAGTTKSERRTRTVMRFSARQIAEQGRLATERDAHSATYMNEKAAETYERTFELPHTERRFETARGELFYFSDPLQFRSPEDHQALLVKLDQQIAGGGVPGIVYLVRGLCRLRLNRVVEAELDFNDAVDVEAALQPLADIAEGRRLLLLGNETAGIPLANKGANAAKRHPHAALLFARFQIDRGDFAAASRALSAALTAGADPLETHLALAWANAAAPADEAGSPRLALSSAQKACQLTRNADWLSLAALAAAQAKNNQFDEAKRAMSKALERAPPLYAPQCQIWSLTIAQKNPIILEWK